MENEKQQAAKRERGTGYVFSRPGSKHLWLQYYVDGKRVRVSADTDNEKVAAKKLRLLTGQSVAGVHADTSRVTFEDMVAAYYEDYQTNGRKSLRFDGEGNPSLDKVKRLAGFFDGYEAREITTDLVRKFIVDQQAKGLSNGSIVHSTNALARMFNLMRQGGRLRDVPFIPRLKASAPRKGFFERAEYDALIAAFEANVKEYGHLRVPVAIAYSTGVRLDEVLTLRWSQVDLLRNVITLEVGSTKNGDGRIAPLCSELRALLVAQHAGRKGCEWVCYRINRKGHMVRVQSFRKAWYSCCIRAGLGRLVPVLDAKGQPLYKKPRGIRSKPKPKMSYQGKLFHDLRRTGVRNLIRANVDRDTAKRISGHKSDSVFSRYNIVSERDILDAGKLLDTFNAQQAEQAKQAAEKFGHSLATVDAFSGKLESVN
jgi:integrase